MNGYVVYLDVLLLLNFSMDFLLLWTAGRVLRRPIVLWRLLLAALVGGGYGAAMILRLPPPLLSPPAALLMSLLMLLTAYPFRDRRSFLKLLAAFYGAACLSGGAALAAASWAVRSDVLGGLDTVRAASLLVTAPVLLIVGRRGYQLLRSAWSRESFSAQLTLQAAGRSVRLRALIDTGNDLSEPLSGLPVVVADYRAVASLLPERVRTAWSRFPEQPEEVLQAVSCSGDSDGWLRRLRLVPYASIGRRNGLLLGFKADTVLLEQEGRRYRAQAVVALTQGLSGGCQAVVNPGLLEQGREGAA